MYDKLYKFGRNDADAEKTSDGVTTIFLNIL